MIQCLKSAADEWRAGLEGFRVVVIGLQVFEQALERVGSGLGSGDEVTPFKQRGGVESAGGQPAFDVCKRSLQHRGLGPDARGNVPPVLQTVATVEVEVGGHRVAVITGLTVWVVNGFVNPVLDGWISSLAIRPVMAEYLWA